MKLTQLFFVYTLIIFFNQIFATPSPTQSRLTVASFNVSMEARNYVDEQTQPELLDSGQQILIQHLTSGENQQIKNIAEIIQRVRPDIILLNEFDYIDNPKDGVLAFKKNYLSKSQAGAEPIDYPYYFYAESNTGLPTTFDLNNDGKFDRFSQDAYGFGLYPGHYGMVLLSRYPIINQGIRTFQRFLWSDMPGAQAPVEPESGKPFYSDVEWQNFRLSSKSHWDIPVNVDGETIHILASHPTPPVFDGPEDRNGKRNHDEIRFWLDYITPDKAGYIYDDRMVYGGLIENAKFVITGDLNASQDRIEDKSHALHRLLGSKLVNNSVIPASNSGAANRPDNSYAKHHTASWGSRADYVLPSSNIKLLGGEVFWPTKDDELHYSIFA